MLGLELEVRESVKVALGGNVDSAFLLFKELVRQSFHSSVNKGKQQRDRLSDLILAVKKLVVSEEFFRDRGKGLFRPVIEPIQSTAGNQRREIPAPHSEAAPQRRHTENHVEVQAHFIQVGMIDSILSGRYFFILHDFLQADVHPFEIFFFI